MSTKILARDVLKAKDLIEKFLENEIEKLVKILGENHPYLDSTVGDIKRAFEIVMYYWDNI